MSKGCNDAKSLQPLDILESILILIGNYAELPLLIPLDLRKINSWIS